MAARHGSKQISELVRPDCRIKSRQREKIEGASERRTWHQGGEERNNVEARERGQRCETRGWGRKFNCLIAVNYLIAPE